MKKSILPNSGVRSTYSQIMEDKIEFMLSEARALCDEGKAESAVAKMTRAIVIQPNNPELFKLRAEASISSSNYHAAIINFNRVVALNPDERSNISKRLGAAHYLQGVSMAAEKNHTEAVEMFEKASILDPENKETLTKRVECLIALKRYTECLGLVEKELNEDGFNNADLLVIRAQLNLLFGKTAECYHDVHRALELSDEHSEALEMKKDLERRAFQCKNEAVHQSLLGRGTDALNKINIALESNPGVPDFHILRGSLFRKMGDYSAAVDDYLVAMEKCGYQQESPVYQNASKQLVLTYNDFAMECFRQKQFDNAITLLNKAIKEEKKERGLYLNRGDCFYRMNKLQFALSDYQQALELDPTVWDVYCRVAVVCGEIGVELFGKGKYSEADEFFSSAIQHNPKVSWFYTCRARARQELKDIDGCKEDIVCSLALNPKSDNCLSLIAGVYSGKTKEDIISLTQHHAFTQIKSKLKAVMENMSLKVLPDDDGGGGGGGGGDKGSSPLPKYMNGVVLKFADDFENESVSLSRNEAVRLLPHDTTEVCVLPPITTENQKSDDVMKEEEKDLGPCEWSVLTCTLPSLPDICTLDLNQNPQSHSGVQPVLQDCLQEAEFHKSIYYSKKSCTEELEEFLRRPPEDYLISRPPRIQNVQDLTVGGRTIVSAGTLRKSIS